jgi:uncharacterized protein (DUF2267 family)
MRLARSEKDLKATADYLWQIALGIEGGDAANAERKVKDAQQALSDALNRNASDAEIRKLTEELRKAMNEFMQALAKQMQNNPDQNQMTADQRKMLRQQDLEKMLDEIQKLAESGSRDEARNLLNQMQRMMNNLQTARPNKGQQQARTRCAAKSTSWQAAAGPEEAARRHVHEGTGPARSHAIWRSQQWTGPATLRQQAEPAGPERRGRSQRPAGWSAGRPTGRNEPADAARTKRAEATTGRQA